MRRTLLVIASLLCAAALYGAVIGGYFDLLIRSGPGNPASGKARVYVDSGTNLLTCLLSTGTSCMPGGGGLSASGYYLTDGTNYYLPSLHMFPATLPNPASFSWLNQGTATETVQNGSLVMTIVGQTMNQRLRVMSIAGTTQITAAMMTEANQTNDCCDPSAGFAGIGLYESAHSGVLLVIGTTFSGGGIIVNRYGDGLSAGRNFEWDFANTVNSGQPVALRIVLDSTIHLILFQFSKDGVNFEDGYCEAWSGTSCGILHPYAATGTWSMNVVSVPYWPDLMFYMGGGQNTSKTAKIELLSWEAH